MTRSISLIELLRLIPSMPISSVPIGDVNLLRPSVFERSSLPSRAFLRSCQFGIINPVLALPDGSILDGGRRWIGAKMWHHETIPCRKLECNLDRDKQIRLAIFLNQHSTRRLAVNVGDGADYVDPIPVELDDLESRLNHARQILEIRLKDDIAFAAMISKRRREFSSTYEECVDDAVQAARSLESFERLWEKPPIPVSAATYHAKEAIWQLSLIQNSRSDDVVGS